MEEYVPALVIGLLILAVILTGVALWVIEYLANHLIWPPPGDDPWG